MEKDFQDIQQLDSEENDHQLSGDEEQGPHVQNSGIENPHWKGKCPGSEVSLGSLSQLPIPLCVCEDSVTRVLPGLSSSGLLLLW